MKTLYTFITAVLITSISLAQTYVNEDRLIENNSLNNQNEQLNVAQKQSFTNANTNTAAPSGNSVFIQQVGTGNIGLIDVSSNNSVINLNQDGFKNISLMSLRAENIRANVTQLGTQNLFIDYSRHGAQSHEVDLLQDGSYNQVISIGVNSISERLQLTQTGIGKSAFIIHN